MPLYLAVTPSELSACRSLRVPLVHMAYALGREGLLRSALPRGVQGGLMGLSDRCEGSLRSSALLCRQIEQECRMHHFSGVLADFDGSESEDDRLHLLTQLCPILRQSGKRLYVPEGFPVPEATVLICSALSGGTLRERLSDVCARYGANALSLDCQRLAMDFLLPCRSGEGTPLSPQQLDELRSRYGAAVFFSDALCANYFSYPSEGSMHFVLFDTVETLRRKVELGRERGIQTAFFAYPEVRDLLPALFRS